MKRNRKIFSVLACVMAMALLFTACAGNGGAAETGDGVEGAEVTMILKNFANPFWISVREGAEAAAEYYGMDLTVLAPLIAESNEEQSQMADQAIVNEVDLVIMCPTDTYAIIPAVERIYEAGIPIVALNTRIGGDILWETFVAVENYNVGYDTMTALAELMGGEGYLILLEGVPGAQSSIDRIAGAHSALENFPGITLLTQQSAEFNRAIAMDVMQNLLQAHPNVTGIYAANDEMALGAVQAIDAAGLTGQILIAGTDANDDAIQAMKDGLMSLTCSTQPFMQGWYAVSAAAEVLRGNELPDFFRVPIRVLGVDDLDDWLD